MNENDLFDALAAPSKEKLAGIMDSLKMVPRATIEYVKAHPQEVAGALVGAGALTLAQYTQNRPGKDGTSIQQRLSQRVVDSTEDMKDEAERSGKPLGFFKDLTQATAPAVKGVSDVLARHPVKGALLVAPAGASLGYGLASKFLKHGSAKPCVTKKATMTKLSAMADQWGRELAHDGMVKEALPSLMGVAAGKAMHFATAGSAAARVGGGAALGAGAGAARHMMQPKDEQGNRKGSLLASMGVGAGAGALGGAALKPGAQALAGMNNKAGKFLGGALTREARATGNVAATQAARQSAAVRGAKNSIARGAAPKALPAQMTSPGVGTQGPAAMPLKPGLPGKGGRALPAPAAAPSATATPAAAPAAPKPPPAPNPAAKPQQGVVDRIRGFGRTVAPSIFGP